LITVACQLDAEWLALAAYLPTPALRKRRIERQSTGFGNFGAMTDQQLILAALHQMSLIMAEHLKSGSLDPEETIIRLIAVLDMQELVDAVTRFEREQGFGWPSNDYATKSNWQPAR
jgi:hypothetical protein